MIADVTKFSNQPLVKEGIKDEAGVFSTPQLERVFGPNTIFAINPWHPRHEASVAALAFGTIHLLYQSFRPSDKKLYFMVLFNAITSRVNLHVGNQLAGKLR